MKQSKNQKETLSIKEITALTLAPSSRGRALALGRRRHAGALGHGLSVCRLAGRFLLGRRGVPVVHHLRGENDVEGKASDESIKDELVVNLLDRGEDAGKRSDEVVEDLTEKELDATRITIGRNKSTYCERAQLSGSSLTPDGKDLGQFASDAQRTRAGL